MMPLHFSIELNIDSASFLGFPFPLDLFNKHLINRPAGITREYTTIGNIDWIIAGLKGLHNFYDSICNVFRWILEQVICPT